MMHAYNDGGLVPMVLKEFPGARGKAALDYEADEDGLRVLDIAARQGHDRCVRSLLDAGATLTPGCLHICCVGAGAIGDSGS